jgi:glycerophosphoryl diester phosphodiesterase
MAGLLVHPYTFRQENAFLPVDFQKPAPGVAAPNPGAPGDLEGELRRFLELGIDGFFIDQPGVGVRVRDRQR